MAVVFSDTFESGVSTWHANSSTVTSDSTKAVAGSKSMKVVLSNVLGAEGVDLLATHPATAQDSMFAVDPNTVYLLEGYIYGNGTGGFRVLFDSADASFTYLTSQGALSQITWPAAWTKFTYTVRTPATAAYVNIRFLTSSSQAITFWVDSVTVTSVPSSLTWARPSTQILVSKKTSTAAAPPATPSVPPYGISTGAIALSWDSSTRAFAIAEMVKIAGGTPFAVRFDAGLNTPTYNLIEGCLANGLTPYLVVPGTTGPISADSTGQQLAAKYVGEGLIFTGPNEPDLHGWTPAQLTAYQSPFYDSVKAGDPDCLVGYGALWKGNSGTTGPQAFISRFISDCPTKADFFSFHGYDSPVAHTSESWNIWGYWFPLGFYNGNTCSELLTAAGLGAKPIISDECGRKTTGLAQWTDTTGSSAGIKELLDQSGSRIDGTFIFSLLPDYDTGWQIIESDHTERIAYTNFVTYVSSGSTPPPSTFGNTTLGSIDDTQGLDLKEVYAVTVPTTGNVAKLTGYVSGLGSGVGNQPLKGVMYTNSAGNPGTLMGVSAEVTVNDNLAYAWTDFTFASPVAVTAGSTVWIGYHGGGPDNGNQLKAFSGTGVKYNLDTYTDGPAATFGAPTASGTKSGYSLYATYA